MGFAPRLVFLGKLGQRKLACAANDMINWLGRRVTYISPRVSLSFWREMDVPRSASLPRLLPLSLPNRGLSAESAGPPGGALSTAEAAPGARWVGGMEMKLATP